MHPWNEGAHGVNVGVIVLQPNAVKILLSRMATVGLFCIDQYLFMCILQIVNIHLINPMSPYVKCVYLTPKMYCIPNM